MMNTYNTLPKEDRTHITHSGRNKLMPTYTPTRTQTHTFIKKSVPQVCISDISGLICRLFLRTSRKIMAPITSKPPTPPATPPAIAPTLTELEDELGCGCENVIVDEGDKDRGEVELGEGVTDVEIGGVKDVEVDASCGVRAMLTVRLVSVRHS
jgi:hypothetical protein